jgi:hypothetical protein
MGAARNLGRRASPPNRLRATAQIADSERSEVAPDRGANPTQIRWFWAHESMAFVARMRCWPVPTSAALSVLFAVNLPLLRELALVLCCLVSRGLRSPVVGVATFASAGVRALVPTSGLIGG